jgi:hypothetical protein
MPAVYGALVIGDLILLLAAAGWGMFTRGGPADRHVLLAVLGLLLCCLIQVVAFTYLTVTGKWIAQAVHLGRLGDEPIREAQGYKRSATRQVGVMITAMLPVVVTGAIHWREQDPSEWHLLAAAAVLVAYGMVSMKQYDVVVRNGSLVERTMKAYRAVRPSSVRFVDEPTTESPSRPI